MQAQPLTASPRYRDFTLERDRALETILHKYQSVCDLVMSKLWARIRGAVLVHFTHPAPKHVGPKPLTAKALRSGGPLDSEIDRALVLAFTQLEYLIRKLRKTAYALSHVAEAEAITRALGKPARYRVTRDHLETAIHRETPSGGDLSARLELARHRLKHAISDAIRRTEIMGQDAQAAVKRVMRAFPKPRPIQKPAKVFKHRERAFREKKAGDPSLESTGFVDTDTWDEVLDAYFEEALPESIYRRAPEDKTILFDIDEEDGSVAQTMRYDWEIEREVTQDFVAQVREGSIDAANENGITDFLWIAVIDGKTCDDCCVPRDGLTTQEIEAAFASGDLDEGDNDSVTAPAHFNCRCQNSPMTDDMPDVPPSNAGSFHEWMNSGAVTNFGLTNSKDDETDE